MQSESYNRDSIMDTHDKCCRREFLKRASVALTVGCYGFLGKPTSSVLASKKGALPVSYKNLSEN